LQNIAILSLLRPLRNELTAGLTFVKSFKGREMTKFMKYGLFVGTLVLSSSTFALAHPGDGKGHNPGHDPGHYPGDPNPQRAPEIDPSLAVGAVSLIGGLLVVQRSRRSR
jgi:hypothetical protein